MYRKATTRRVVRNARRWSSLTLGLTAGCVVLFSGPAAGVANADSLDWDAVAECESGGDWEADTGNGFYGGLQFKETTWREFGGTGSPAKASRAEQITVANRVLAKQGPGAWPKCGPRSITASPATHPGQQQLPQQWRKMLQKMLSGSLGDSNVGARR